MGSVTRRLGRFLAVGAVALAVTAGGGGGGGAGGGAGAATAAQPTKHRSSPVTAKIELAKKQVTAGKLVRGTLVLTNASRKKIDLTHVCTPQWEVALGKGKEAPPLAFSQVCGVAPFPVKPGRNKFPFEISTAGLGAGRYHAFLVASDPSFPPAKPAPVRIVAAS